MQIRVFLLSLGIAATLHAQSTTGTILGSVNDTSGAFVPAARITVRNLDENTSVSGRSDTAGFYEFVNLKPGRYEVRAEHGGFSSAEAAEVSLEARQVRRVDFRLEVAPRTETTVVTALVPKVTTDTATIADSQSFEQITRLPINTRGVTASPFTAILAAPGVQQDSAGRPSIAGGLTQQIEYSVDGISTVSIASHFNNDGLGPSPEMVQEFRVTSVNAGPAFGPMGDVTVVSRSGTNQLHGSALWYHQNRALDSKTWGAPQKQQKVSNEFGVSVGGPVEIPRVFHGQNRTFFFADLEGNRRPQTTLIQKSVPASAARAGDLSAAAGGSAVDPLSGSPFPGNRIPLNRINPVATRLFNTYYPLPNFTAPGSANNFLDLVNAGSSTTGYDLRLDHVVTARQRVFGRWSWRNSDALRANTPLPSSDFVNQYSSLVFGHTHSVSARLFNEIRIGFNRAQSREMFPIRGRDAVANLGLLGLSLQNAGDSGGFPWFDFSEATGYTTAYHYRPAVTESRNFQATETLSYVRHGHILKFGADIRRIGYRGTLHGGNGADDFGGFYFAANGFSGNAFSDLLLGLPYQTSYASLGPNVHEFDTHAAFFAADTWRLSSRLTLELGLRWEVHPPMLEAAGNLTNFDHSTGDVIVPDRTLPAAPGFLTAIHACSAFTGSPCTRILTASQAGLPQGLRTTDWGDWSPRLGVAWRPWNAHETVIRAGIGLYIQIPLGGLAFASTGIHSSDVRDFINGLDDKGEPLIALPNILPQPDALGAVGREGFSLGVDPHLRDPRSYQWNVTMERALIRDTTVRASYIGVQSVGIPVRADFNQVRASTEPFSFSRVPYARWGYLGSIENIGFANYQGLHLEAVRRTRNGIYFQAAYMLSKFLGTLGSAGQTNFPAEATGVGVTDRFNTRYDRGNLEGVRRNRFLLTGIFPLPFGRGKSGANSRHLAQALVGGWELSAITLIQSGPFLTPMIAGTLDRSNTNLGSRSFNTRPDRIGNGNLPDRTADRYFDRLAFAAVPAGAVRFGNSGAGVLVGPGTVAIAAGLAKTFSLSERIRLRLEGTFTNLPNHPNFLPPSTNINQPTFGRLTTVQSVENSGNRTGQVGARIEF